MLSAGTKQMLMETAREVGIDFERIQATEIHDSVEIRVAGPVEDARVFQEAFCRRVTKRMLDMLKPNAKAIQKLGEAMETAGSKAGALGNAWRKTGG